MIGTGRPWARLLIGFGFAAGFLWLALRRIDLNQVARTASTIPWVFVAAALLSLAGSYVTRIVRWWTMLRVANRNLRMRSCAWPLLVSVAVNNIAPFRAGDALRVIGFRDQLITAPARLLGSLLVERLLDLTALLALFFFGIANASPESIPAAYMHACTAIAVFALCIWTAALAFGPQLGSLCRRACKHRLLVARGWNVRVEEQLQLLFAAVSVLRDYRLGAWLLVLTLIIWSFEGAVFASVAYGLHYGGAPAGPWFAAATGTLATLIPSSPGYVGTFEFFAMAGLIAYGAARTLAAAFALAVHAILWLPLTAAGSVYFLLAISKTQRAIVAGRLIRNRDHA